MGSMQLMLVEGEEEGEGEGGGGGHSCGVFQEPQWELHADILRGVVYATDTSNSNPDHRLWEVEVSAVHSWCVVMGVRWCVCVCSWVCLW